MKARYILLAAWALATIWMAVHLDAAWEREASHAEELSNVWDFVSQCDSIRKAEADAFEKYCKKGGRR